MNRKVVETILPVVIVGLISLTVVNLGKTLNKAIAEMRDAQNLKYEQILDEAIPTGPAVNQ